MLWDYFLENHVGPGIEAVALGFVINDDGYSFITRRRQGDYLQEAFEIPVGLVRLGKENLLQAATRILKSEYGLDLVSIDYFLTAFTFISPKKKKTRQFNFVVRVADSHRVQIARNDHGLWMCKEEMGYWPLMKVIQEALMTFWIGEGYSALLADFLVESAKKEDIWRHKVRLIPIQEKMVLLLKRSRRQKILPLYYEFPGKEIPSGVDVDTVIVEAMQEQTGYPPEAVVGYAGYYDYISDENFDKVREFIYFVAAQKGQKVKLATHAYAFWTEDFSLKKVEVTPCVHAGMAALGTRFILGQTPQKKTPPPRYCDVNKTPKSMKQRKQMDAWTKMCETGKVDLKALDGQVLVNRAFAKKKGDS